MTLRLDLHLQRSAFSLQLTTDIERQGVTAIYGASGAGKTSLLRCIAGLERGTGSIYFGEHCWQHGQQFCPSHQRGVGFVFQNARLLPHLSVAGNLAFAAKRRFGHNSIEQAAIIDALDLHALLPQAATTLSAGQQQRVAIARALLSQPRLLLMDEPLANLDQRSRQHILPMLEQLTQQLAIPVLYVSHQLEEVCQLAGQMLLLEQGKRLAQGPTTELLGRLDLPLSHQQNAASIVPSRVIGHDDHYQLTELATFDGQPLWVTRLDATVGSELKLRIPARDVSLALTDAADSSILNRLRARIIQIEHSHSSRVLVKLQLGSHQLLARLTQKSVDRLQLTTGQTVYAQVKTVALLNEF